MIEISQLSFRYREGAEPILHGIDLAIPDGSFVGITGAAGSGKSHAHVCVQRHHPALLSR